MVDKPYIRSYRKYNMSSGCFIRYNNFPQSYEAIHHYLQDSVGPESVDRRTWRGDSNWFMDQKLISLRLAQWGKNGLKSYSSDRKYVRPFDYLKG